MAAQHGSVKMWVADRNFADLPGVAKRTFGAFNARNSSHSCTHTSPRTRSSAWWAGIGLWVLTGWTAYTVDKFLTAPCPKVIAADAHDEVVVWLSSMAVTSARVATPALCANTLSTHTQVGVAKSVALTSTPSRGAAGMCG